MTMDNQGSMDRRSILKAGILAAGAAMLPTAATAATGSHGALEQLREEYQRRVKALAARLAPEYASINEARTTEDEVLDAAHEIEDACREEFCRTADEARVVLAVSPHWDNDDWFCWADVRRGISCCVALDVAAAMGAEWYLRGAGLDIEVES